MWYALNFAVKACLARRRLLLSLGFCHCAEDEDHIDGEARGKPAHEMKCGAIEHALEHARRTQISTHTQTLNTTKTYKVRQEARTHIHEDTSWAHD